MKTQVQNLSLQPQENPSTPSAVKHPAERSMSRSIQEKIQEMSKSLAQGGSSPSSAMHTLKQMQADRQQHQKHISSVQRQMLSDLNIMERNLLAFDRQRMMHKASSKVIEEQIQEKLDDFEYDLKKLDDCNHEKQLQYRDKISSLKVQMVELENICHQKSLKVQRQTTNKLTSLQKNLQTQNIEVKQLNELISKGFKDLRVEIEIQARKILQDKRKASQKIAELGDRYSMRVQQERKRQKEGFQQHYKTLQAIFRLFEQDVK